MKDVIIVLGGQLNRDGTLPDIVMKRLEKSFELLRAGEAPRLLLSGGQSPFFKRLKLLRTKTEAVAMKEYALSLGIPKSALYTEEESSTTFENALFCKVGFLEKNDWKNILVVTSDFHIERAELIFKSIYGQDYQIEYVSSPTNFTPKQRRIVSIREKLLKVGLKTVRVPPSTTPQIKLSEK